MLMRGEKVRHIREWFDSLQPDYLMNRPSPWITFDAIDFLEEFVQPGMHVFEFGSGGSTLYWISKQASVISVEHDPQWYGVVRKRVGDNGRLDYRLVVPVQRSTSLKNDDPSDPGSYSSDDAEFVGWSFEGYVRQIDQVADNSQHVVLVDGRSRPSCIVHAIPKIAKGGILVLDNAERPYYLSRTQEMLSSFRLRRFSGMTPCNRWTSQTNIYLREA